MYIKSRNNEEVLKAPYIITDEINGNPTIETEYLQLEKRHEEPITLHSPVFADSYALVLKDQESKTESSRLQLTGVHSFIYDLSLGYLYEEYTQYFSVENMLSLLFANTGYSFEVKGNKTYYAEYFQNFGDNNLMQLIHQACGRWELEFEVKDKHVVFSDRRGSKSDTFFRYKMNILGSQINLDITKGATFILGKFGKKPEEEGDPDTYVEKPYTHPLSEYYGIKHAKPYSNENITVEATMLDYLKRKVEETWKLSIEIDVAELIGSGQVNVGDTVWAIDERMDIEIQMRIVKLIRYYDLNDRVYKVKATLGNHNYIDSVHGQQNELGSTEDKIEDALNKRVEQLNADFDNRFNQGRDEIVNSVQEEMERQKLEVEADLNAWKLYEEQARQSIKDSVDNIIGDMDSIDTTIEEWQNTASSRFNTIESNLLDKLNFGDLQPLESRLEASEKGIEGVFTNIGQLSGARNLLSSENIHYISAANMILAGGVVSSGDYVLSVQNSLYQNKGLTLQVYSIIDDRIVYHINTVLTNMSTPFRFNLGNEIIEAELVLNIENFTMADFEKAKIQLERGTEMTEWSPALIDVDTNMAEMSSRLTFNEERLETTFTKIDNLKIGTKNIVRNSNLESNWDYWDNYEAGGTIDPEAYRVLSTFNGVRRLRLSNKTSEGWYGVRQTLPDVKISEEYTVSMYVRSNAGNGQISLALTGSSDMIFDVTPTLKRISFTHTAPLGTQYLFIRTPKGVPVDIFVQDIQVERGSIVSDYAPNPEDALDEITKDIADFQITADGLSSTVGVLRSDLDDMEKWSLAAGSDWQQTKDGFDAYVVSNNQTIGGLQTDVSNVVQRAESISSTVSSMRGDVDDLEAWRADAGSKWEQTAQAITGRVWTQDIDALRVGGKNLLRNSAIEVANTSRWRAWPTDTQIQRVTVGNKIFVQARTIVPGRTNYGVQPGYLAGDRFEIVEGRPYVFSFEGYSSLTSDDFTYVYLMRTEGANQGRLTPYKIEDASYPGNASNKRYYFRFTANWSSENAYLLIGTTIPSNWQDTSDAKWLRVRDIQITEGNKEVPYAEAPEDFIQHTDFRLQADGFFLGTTFVGGSHYATAIVGDASGLKLIGDKISIDGNLDVLGKIRSEAIDSVYANISQVRTRILIANSIKANMLDVNQLMAEKFYTHTAFINNASIKAANIRDLETISLTSEQVRVGFNKIGSNIQIVPSGLDTFSGSTRTSRLNASGHEFFRKGKAVGSIGTSEDMNNTNVGLSIQLEGTQSSFYFGKKSDLGVNFFSPKFSWSEGAGFAGHPGFSFFDNVRIAGDVTIDSRSTLTVENHMSAVRGYFGPTASIRSTSAQSRLYFGENTYLFLNQAGGVGVYHNGAIKYILLP